MTTRTIRDFSVPLLLFTIATGGFFIFTYNSGYGYDALEYLVIGRSLLDGWRLYDFIPSKSWGLYALIAAFLSPGNTGGHASLTTLITAAYGITLATVFLITRRRYSRTAAYIAAGLTALCAIFMEMNYLEPEIFVFLFGLAAFSCLTASSNRTNWKHYFAAGISIGIGAAFKMVAGFYIPAILLFIVIQEHRNPVGSWRRMTGYSLSLLSGFAFALLPPLLYFALTGRLDPYMEWTWLFPLLHRPAGTFWFFKLSTKLLWFFALLAITLLGALFSRKRHEIYSDRNTVLALSMGLFSLAALLKQQASHYVFPAAGFLSIYMAAVFQSMRPKRKYFAPVLLAAAALLAVMLSVSIMRYNPRALRRFTHLADYSREAKLAAHIQQRIKEDDLALFFNRAPLLYWISRRYPAVPFVKFDVQETFWLQQHPETLPDALDNPHLKLVEFNPDRPGIKDRSFFEYPGSAALLSAFNRKLVMEFALADKSIPPYLFWQRRNHEDQ